MKKLQDIKLNKGNLYVLLFTAGIAMRTMGVAYLAGLALYYLIKKNWVTMSMSR